MQYLLLINEDHSTYEAEGGEAVMADTLAKHVALAERLNADGVSWSGNRLRPPSDATTLRYTGGKHVVRDGAFAETHEQLGGYYLVDVADLDKAIEYASLIPVPGNGAIEVRPVWSMD